MYGSGCLFCFALYMIETLPHQSSESEIIKETQDDLSHLKEQIGEYDFLTNERLKQALENYDGS